MNVYFRQILSKGCNFLAFCFFFFPFLEKFNFFCHGCVVLMAYGILIVQPNGSAKLKQIKLDVRREQWLSRVKKGCNVDSNGRVDHCRLSKHLVSEENRSSPYKENGRKRRDDIQGTCTQGNDSGSVTNNSVQNTFDHDESVNDFSGDVSEEDGCLDDWEAVADALDANESDNLNLHSVVSESPPVIEAVKNPKADFSETYFRSTVPELHLNCQAWKPDDAFRPQCLPNLSKQHRSPLSSNWHGNHRNVPWAWQMVMSQPPHCPICYEDLDVTDSSFLPCSCGFCLCLFCHKKILEADGRCPGCRKLYDCVDVNVGFNIGAKAFHITQSCSMSTGC